MAATLMLACSNDKSGGHDGDEGVETEVNGTQLDGNTTLYGLVTDTSGNPVPGVVVSDGYGCVTTDANGVYQMERYKKARFVHYSTPAGYAVNTSADNYPLFYSEIVHKNIADRHDFVLTPLPAPESDFTLVCIADPQCATTAEISRYVNETIPDVEATVDGYKAKGTPVYGITLGDIVFDTPDLWSNMKESMANRNLPIFQTIGNHDHLQTETSDDNAAANFETQFGPRNYSFNRGDVHFIAMDNIIFTGTDYTGGFTDEQVAWLEKDLGFVPTDKMVILYYHIPLRDNTGYLNRKKVLDMISRYKNPTLMCAHTHYFQPYHMRSHKLFERIHGGTCGYFWRSTCGGDGTPNGFMVYEIDGTEIIDTYFKASQRADDYQIRLYRGNAEFAGPYATYKYDVGADVVVANVFTSGMDDTTWKVELSEDGGKTWSVMTEMSQSYGDRWIRGYHIGVEKHPVESGTSPCYHQYQCKLKNPEATGIVVRATDSFNHVYTQTRFNESNDFTEAEGY